MSTLTYSSTYTITDVAKVVDRFAADYDMIANATGLETRARVDQVVHDIKLMAQRGYIDAVDVALRSAQGRTVRAVKYTVSRDASLWSSDRPGDNMWPRQISGELAVIVSYSQDWWALSQVQRETFKSQECWVAWGANDIDVTYRGMTARQDRRYASNGYGFERTLYRGE